VPNNNTALALFFIVFMVVGSFFVIQVPPERETVIH
jgi:hypothetical protein